MPERQVVMVQKERCGWRIILKINTGRTIVSFKLTLLVSITMKGLY